MNQDPSVAAAMLLDAQSVETPPGKAHAGGKARLSRKSKVRRKSRGAGTNADEGPGLEGDASAADLKQDTPGRHKSASRRQQTQPHQKAQTGRAKQDSEDR